MSFGSYFNGKDGSSFTSGIVSDRGDGKGPTGRTDLDKKGSVSVRYPGIDGNSVQDEHIALVAHEKPIDNLCIFAGVPDYGCSVGASNNPGETRRFATNIWSGINDTTDSVGNMNLMQILASFASLADGRNRPPKYREVEKDGAKIREIVELGKWFFSLTKGIPLHAAMAEIAGLKLPEINNIPTALQHFGDIPTQGMLSNLAGSTMSIGSVLQQTFANSNNFTTITQDKPQQIVDAFQSLADLSQYGDTMELGGSVTGVRVNTNIFTPYCIEMFRQCETVADILNTMVELSTNTAYHGADTEDLVLTLGDGSGNFMRNEPVYQMSESDEDVLIGNVISWNPVQKVLETTIVNHDLFNPEKKIYTLQAQYTIDEYTYFVIDNKTTYTSNNVFGQSETQVDSRGNVRQNPSNQAFQAAQNFVSQMSAFSSFQSALDGRNLFGRSSGTIFDMLKRLPPDAMAAAKPIIEGRFGPNQKFHQDIREAQLYGQGRNLFT